jgi:hypothetical protein
MNETSVPRTRRTGITLAVVGLVVAAIFALFRYWPSEPAAPAPEAAPPAAAEPAGSQPPRVLALESLPGDPELKSLMAERKDQFNVDESLDIIARSDEEVHIGEHVVSMRELQEQIKLRQGDIAEQPLGADGQLLPGKLEMFGIYVVQPGDNLWNIHFRLLQDYFRHQGVQIAPRADEPRNGGMSSGVGKLLKFSENIVHIYNLKEKQFSADLNLIEPRSKIVVYNMTHVFSLLDQIDYRNIDRIQFDGDTLWLPSS